MKLINQNKRPNFSHRLVTRVSILFHHQVISLTVPHYGHFFHDFPFWTQMSLLRLINTSFFADISGLVLHWLLLARAARADEWAGLDLVTWKVRLTAITFMLMIAVMGSLTAIRVALAHAFGTWDTAEWSPTSYLALLLPASWLGLSFLIWVGTLVPVCRHLRWRAANTQVTPLAAASGASTASGGEKDNSHVIHIERALNEIRENATPKAEETSQDSSGGVDDSVAEDMEGGKDDEELLDPDVIFWSPAKQLAILLASSLTRFLLAILFLVRMYKIGVALDDPEYPVNNIFEALVLTEEVEAFIRFSLLVFKSKELFVRMSVAMKKYCKS